MRKIAAFIRFCRLHTIIATGLQVTGLFILVYGSGQRTPESWALLVPAFFATLAANIYIVGLNQLADVEIDRINKPYLPLAAGDFSLRQGQWIVAIMGFLAICLAATQSLTLLLTVMLAMVIGTVYSLPPLHLKSRPLWAALSIAFVRGFVANIGLYVHFHRELQQASTIPWSTVMALTVFFFGFGLVIALYKDIPDLIGDRQYGIRTFTVRLGPGRVFLVGRLVLTAFYLALIGASWTLLPGTNGFVVLFVHLAIVILFWIVSRSVNPAEPVAITRFYMFLWLLFYAEYILLGLSALLVA